MNDKMWSDIPALVIMKIYMYLNMSDKISMSLVCKNWWISGLPELWKHFTLRLYDHSSISETWPEVELANKYGYMFRYVTIFLNENDLDDTSKISTQLRMFCETLTGSKAQLISLKMDFSNAFFYDFMEKEREKVFRCTLNFIKSQNKLENVSFVSTNFNYEDGIELLKTLFKHCCNLKSLELESFLYITAYEKVFSNSNQICKSLAPEVLNLKKLAIDDLQLFQKVFADFEELQCTTRSNKILSEIVVQNNYDESGYYRIPQIPWKSLKIICPALKVKVILHTTFSEIKDMLETYLMEFMPVTEISLSNLNEIDNLNQIDLEFFFQRICSTEIVNCIRDINIDNVSQVDDISISLIPFFDACPKLFRFSITIKGQVKGFESLFEYLLNKRLENLKFLNIEINMEHLSIEYHNRVTILVDIYYPLFKKINLDVTVRTNLGLVE